MMIRLFAAALLITWSASSPWCSEVVVFDSSRSLIVQSHRQEGEWVYLRVGSGEIAVRADSIVKIVKEGVVVPSEPPASAAPPAKAEPAPPASPAPAGRQREVLPGAGEARAKTSAPDTKKPAETSISRVGARAPMGPGPAARGTTYAPMPLQGGDLQDGAVAQRRRTILPRPAPPADAPPGD